MLMKLKRILLFSLTLIISLSTSTHLSNAVTTQSGGLYQDMSLTQRRSFVADKAGEISRRISGRDYQFTPAFEIELRKSVDFYAQRIGNNAGDVPGRGDARFAFERGQGVARMLNRIFKTHNVSPLIGLYLPMVESEYRNLESPNAMG